ncbi:MAG: class I SAM-dependent methyltransferase [Vicinamibacterales bacterium]
MSDWDAARYHRISAPQFDWGQRVLARLQPAEGERILDLGCGTGRITQEILAAVDGGSVTGVDLSGAMLAVARASRAGPSSRHLRYVQASGVALPFSGAFDAVFSAATLHWIRNHEAVFGSVHAALKPGGRFVAQCGGAGNLRRLLEHAAPLMQAPAYRRYFDDWRDPWHFADPETTAARQRAAGFTGVEAWLEEAPVDLATADAYNEFVSCVCIRHHLERLPLNLREPFANELTERAARDSPPFVLDYWRLNISGGKAPA